MAISKKRPPQVDDPQLNRTIQKIYDDINEVINAVNQGDTSTEKVGYKGKAGDIRLSRQADGSYEIQGKTNEGWVSTAMTYKEK